MRKLVRVMLLVALALGLAGCLGPKPMVRSYSVQAPPTGSDQPYKVEVVLGNDGPGGGQVEVEVEVANRRTGEIIAQEMKELDLQKDATVRTQLDVKLPTSLHDLNPNDIEVRVAAHYPIE